MRYQTIAALLFSTLALAAPIEQKREAEAAPAPAPEAKADPQSSYASYGSCKIPLCPFRRRILCTNINLPDPPPKGGYTNYGTYGAGKLLSLSITT